MFEASTVLLFIASVFYLIIIAQLCVIMILRVRMRSRVTHTLERRSVNGNFLVDDE